MDAHDHDGAYDESILRLCRALVTETDHKSASGKWSCHIPNMYWPEKCRVHAAAIPDIAGSLSVAKVTERLVYSSIKLFHILKIVLLGNEPSSEMVSCGTRF
jgi:hypothetical protein